MYIYIDLYIYNLILTGVTFERSSVLLPLLYVSIRQHPSAYISIRQHTSAYVSIRQPLTYAG